jgi:putative ribosome biogenesis GTPase RsgA
MFELSKDIYTNFKIDSIKPKLSEKVRAALIGYSGSGKTSLLNNLCKKEHKVGFNRGSTTHDISYEDSVYQP